MNKYEGKWVYLEDVIGPLAEEYGLPYISFDNLVILGKRAMRVYHQEEQGRKITFEMMCKYINDYISTPFGLNSLRRLAV